MKHAVTYYIRKCKVCARCKPEPPDCMRGRSIVNRPWEVLCTDIVGPLPKSKQGYSYILVVADIFSKFPLLFRLRKATAAKISYHL